MNCPHCKQETQDGEFCRLCSRILPVHGGDDYFVVLGYPKRVLIMDGTDLERRFLALNRKFHPDRFAGKTPLEIQLSHDWSSAVNNAYRVLKNPITRAKYVVEQDLGSVEEKSSKVPPDMSDLFFEVHDVLDTIRDSHGNPAEAAVREVRNAEKDLRAKVKSLEADLQQRFSEYDAQPEKAIIEQMKEILSERSYIVSFLRQIDSVLNIEA